MNLREQRKNHYISVKKLILVWKEAGLKGIEKLLMDPNSIIEKNSWVYKVKKLIEEKKFESLNLEISIVSNVFKINQYDREENENENERNKPDSISGG